MAITYVVRTEYQIDDRASAGVGRLSSAFGGLSSVASSAASAFDAVAGKMVQMGALGASLAAAGGLAAVKMGLTDVNAKAEDLQIGLASVFHGLGATNSFEDALMVGAKLMGQIREDAAALPGETADFVAVAQTMSAPLLQAGADLATIRSMTRDTVVVGAQLFASQGKAGIEKASREMAQLLQGHAGGHNDLGMSIGINANTMIGSKKFSAASETERLAFLTEKLSKFKDALPSMRNSWSGLTSTMVDGVKQLLGQATMPLFTAIKRDLATVNDWLAQGGGTMVADRVGHALAETYKWLRKETLWIAEHWTQIAASVSKMGESLRRTFDHVRPIVDKIGTYVAKGLEDPGRLLEGALAARAGLAVASNAPGLMSGAEGLAGGMAGGVGLLGAAALAAAGVVDIWSTNLNDASSGTQQVMLELGQGLTKSIGEMGEGLVKDFKDLGINAWEAIKPLADALGVVLLGAVEGAIVALRGFTKAAAFGFELLTASFVTVKKFFGGEIDVEALKAEPLDKHMATPPTLFGTKGGGALLDDPKTAKDAAALMKKVAASHGAGKTNVTVNVQNTILDQADPERLAMSISHTIVRLAKSPQTALGFPTFQHA